MIVHITSNCDANVDYFLGKSKTALRNYAEFSKYENLDRKLRQLGYCVGWKYQNQSIKNDVTVIICIDHPFKSCKYSTDLKQSQNSDKKKILIITEPYVTFPSNHSTRQRIYSAYDFILTWDDLLVDNIKYFKIFPCAIDWSCLPSREKIKMFCMVCGNKTARHRGSLYSFRKKIIKYFCRRPDYDFDLYGPDWDRVSFWMDVSVFGMLNVLMRKVNLSIPRMFVPRVWAGRVDDKLAVIKDYKFVFCLENQGGIYGLVHEKILEVMLVGSIPVYKGVVNINDYIPSDCFINIDDFRDIGEVIEFCSELSDREYWRYIEKGQVFLESAKNGRLGNAAFVEAITKSASL